MARPIDNLDLDVIDALRMGYGCQYGRYKADHPYTAAANEQRLAAKKRRQPKGPVYEFVCRGCGEKFTTTQSMRRYCSDACKDKKNGAKYRAKHGKKRKEATA